MEQIVSAWLTPYAKGGVMARIQTGALALSSQKAVALCSGSLSGKAMQRVYPRPNWSFQGTLTYGIASATPYGRP